MILRFFCLFSCFFSPLLAQEVVLITGGSQGIGLETAKQLVQEGYRVYATYRVSSDQSSLNQAISTTNGNLIKLLMDVSDQQSVQRAVQEVINKEGKIDVLINNAGVLLYGSWESTTIEQAQHVFDINYFGPMRLMQAVMPHMREKQKGHIINVTSRSAFRPLPSLSVYAASKAALHSASESLAVTVKEWNIKVSCIEPGPVDTNMDKHVMRSGRFKPKEDPYLPIFEKAKLALKKGQSLQPVKEVAQVIVEALKNPKSQLRYQTSSQVKKQAAIRSRDITGQAGLKELETGI